METRVLTLFDDDFFEEPLMPESGKKDIEQESPDVPTDEIPNEKELKEADARELDQQMRSEILAMDYSSFIHKDMPFDPGTAKVVQKDKEIAVPPIPVTEVEAETKALSVSESQTEEFTEPTIEDVPDEEISLAPFELEEKYYSIGEVASMFGVNTSHIRFWTNEFKLKPRTTRKGGRLYLPSDIEQLRLIHHLVKEKKHTIKGAQEKLKQSKTLVENQLDLKTALTQLKSQLEHIKQQL